MRAVFDIETDGLDDATTVHCLWIKNPESGERFDFADQPGFKPISEGLSLLASADTVIGHNILTYDLPTLERLRGFKFTGKVRDTLVMSRLMFANMEDEDFRRVKRANFPARYVGDHNLRSWGFRLGVLKGDFNHDQTTDWSKWTPEMHAYCGQDVEVGDAVLKAEEKLNWSEESVELEHEFRWIIHQQERHGFRFNEAEAGKLYGLLAERRRNLAEKLREHVPPKLITQKTPAHYTAANAFGVEVGKAATKGELTAALKTAGIKPSTVTIEPGPMKVKSIPFNPGSDMQIAEFLISKGWRPVEFTDGGRPKVSEEILKGLTFPEAQPLVEYAVTDKVISQLAEGDNAWLKLSKHGRIHGAVNTNGAVTGRCTHFKPNVAQTPAVMVAGKPPVPLQMYEGRYGWECRSLYMADEGQVLVGADASGLELRCLSHFMARYDGGAYGRLVLDGDVHTANQNAAGIATRAEAKTWIYSYLYGAGDELLGINAGGASPEEIADYKRTQRRRWSHYVGRFAKQERKVNDQILGNCVKGSLLRSRFEQNTPALAQLKADIAAAVNARGYLTGLDGRRLHVRSAHSALNTLLQSAGAIAVKKATVLLVRTLRAEGWTFGREWSQVAHIHDEIQATVRPDLATFYGETAVASIRKAGESFNFRIRLDGEYKIGPTWAATH